MAHLALIVSHKAGDALADRLATREELQWRRVDPADAASTLMSLVAERRDRPVVVVGIGGAAGAAVEAAAPHGSVEALALIGPRLERSHIELVQAWPELALLSVADPTHRPGLAGAVDAHLASHHDASELRVGPIDDAALDHVAGWMAQRLGRRARVADVVVHSGDGWDLHGTLRLPNSSGPDAPAPGVVLLHTGRSDRAAFSRLERLLADAGLAVLNLDWRGRGQSTNLGSYFDLDADTRAAAWRDALAAIGHLAVQREVDADRIGVVGVVHGAEHAVRAAWRDRRVKALVVLTGYRPAEPQETAYLTSGDVDVLYVTSREHTVATAAMRELYEATPTKRSQFVEYPGALIGYQLFELDPALEPQITTWLQEALAAWA